MKKIDKSIHATVFSPKDSMGYEGETMADLIAAYEEEKRRGGTQDQSDPDLSTLDNASNDPFVSEFFATNTLMTINEQLVRFSDKFRANDYKPFAYDRLTRRALIVINAELLRFFTRAFENDDPFTNELSAAEVLELINEELLPFDRLFANDYESLVDVLATTDTFETVREAELSADDFEVIATLGVIRGILSWYEDAFFAIYGVPAFYHNKEVM